MMPSSYIGILTYGVDVNTDKLLSAWIIFVLTSFWLHHVLLKKQSNINTCLMIVFYLYYIPLNSSYYLNNEHISFLILSSMFWLILCTIANVKVSIRNKHAHEITNVEIAEICNSKIFYVVLLAISLGCVIYAYQYNGLIFTLNIVDIYDARAEYVGSSSMLESILYNFGGTLLIPIALLYSLKTKKRGLLILSIIAQLAVFSIARQKGHLLIIGIVIIIFFLFKKNIIRFFKFLIPYACCIALMLSGVEKVLLSSDTIFMLFVRRMMYIPAWLNTIYFDFFSKNKLLLWTQDVFLVNRLGFNRYDDSVLDMINYQYFMGYVASPNTGLFAEAYMHFGEIGAMIYPIVIVILLRVLFRYASYYDQEIQLLVVVSVSMSLTSLPVTSGIFCVTYLTLIVVTMLILFFKKCRIRVKK